MLDRPPTPIDLSQLEARILGRLAGMHWYTLIIEPQAWKRVAERAGEMGYETYCPMARLPGKARLSGLQKLAIQRPLMPGYLFVDMPGTRRRFDLFAPSNDPGGYVADRARPSVEPIQGCRGFLTIDGSPVALHEAVIEDMRLREKNGEFDLTGLSEDGRHRVPKWAKRASTVEFIAGPFAGFFGTVVKAVSATMIEIALTVFGRPSNVRTPLDWVRLAR